MNQRINLYRDELRGVHIALPAHKIVLGVAVLAVLLLTAYAGMYWGSAQTREAAADLRARVKAQTLELKQLTQILQTRKKDPLLQQRLSLLTAELDSKRRLLGVVSGQTQGNTRGFSAHLEGLARQRQQGLWLTQIQLSAGGKELRLQGNTVDARLLPLYLQALSSESAYIGTEFTLFWLGRIEPQNPQLDFVIATRCQPSDKTLPGAQCAKGGGA